MQPTRKKVVSQVGRNIPGTTKDRTFRTFLLMAQLDAEGISARIREARLEAGLTQEQLADLLHVHKKTVENYEHGSINYRALNQVSAILGKPVEWILHGETARSSPEDLRALRQEVEHLQAAVDEILELLRPASPSAGSTSP